MKLNKLKFVLLLLFAGLYSLANATEFNLALDSANNVYSKNDFNKAIKLY